MKRILDRWLITEAPASRLATLRILVGLYALIFLVARHRSFWLAADLPTRQFEGVGVLWFATDALAPTVVKFTFVATVLFGIAFVAGLGFRIVGPAFALLFLFVATYRLSFGHVIHTEHLTALHLLVLGFTDSSDALTCGESTKRFMRRRRTTDYGWPIQIMILMTVTTYVLAGFAKLQHGGLDWLTGDVLRNQIAYDNLRKELLGSPHSPLGGWLVRFGWIFPPAAIATTIIEIGAVVALFHSILLRRIWAMAAWIFHVGVVATMAISFPYPLSFVAYAPLFAVERLWSTSFFRRLISLTPNSRKRYI